ncbi:hypothetical protein TWF481_003830 [Arthrobotrys musiformis]|uniref:F-box domain-containing protein n=1 Tax=Arthrobotrys musiformis TaxID=47236 RepID=A0AAV9WHT1_9PEZI
MESLDTGSTPPAASITSLPLELFHGIIEDLSLNDRASLLRVCKPLYKITYPYLWQTIDSNVYTLDSREVHKTTLSPKKVAKLAEITEAFGADALGFRYTRELIFGYYDFKSYSPWVKTNLLDIIRDQIVSKKMSVSRVRVSWEKCQATGDRVTNFLKMLKNYSELGLERPSITAVQNSDRSILLFPFDLFALECLTSLDI